MGLSVFLGRKACGLFEDAIEVTRTLKSYAVADVEDVTVGVG